MKLYLLENEDMACGPYDYYISCIVAARCEEEARLIRPDLLSWSDMDIRKKKEWVMDPINITVKYIGTAKRGTSSGIIHSSYVNG